MKNNINKIIIIFFSLFYLFNANGAEQFNFDVTEVEIIDNGNKFIGKKRGIVTSDEGVEIEADYFEYDKNLNILKASGSVKLSDKINNYNIYSNNIVYKKNIDIVFTNGNSKAISAEDNINIESNIFEYDRIKNIITAKENVIIQNKIDDYILYSNFISYFKNENKFLTEGKTSGEINSKYKIKSADVIFLRNSNELFSDKNTTITDDINFYSLKKFKFLIDEEQLSGEKIIINSNYKLPDNDKYYFSSGIVDFKNNSFVAKDTEVKIHKSIFNNSNNDPRIREFLQKKW